MDFINNWLTIYEPAMRNSGTPSGEFSVVAFVLFCFLLALFLCLVLFATSKYMDTN
jgi:hypothetical protein